MIQLLGSIEAFIMPLLCFLTLYVFVLLKVSALNKAAFENTKNSLNYVVESDLFGLRSRLARRRAGTDAIYMFVHFESGQIKQYYIPKHPLSIGAVYRFLFPILHASERDRVLALLTMTGTTTVHLTLDKQSTLIINGDPIMTIPTVDFYEIEGIFHGISLAPYIIGAGITVLTAIVLFYYLKHYGNSTSSTSVVTDSAEQANGIGSVTSETSTITSETSTITSETSTVTLETSTISFVDALKDAAPLLDIVITPAPANCFFILNVNMCLAAMSLENNMQYITELSVGILGVFFPGNITPELIMECIEVILKNPDMARLFVDVQTKSITIFWSALNTADIHVCLNFDDFKKALEMVKDVRYKAS